MLENPRRHFLKEKEVRLLLNYFSREFKLDTEQFFGSKPRIELAEVEAVQVFLVNGKPLLAKFRGMLLPTFFFKELLSLLPRIVVDMGAVPYICRGADVMVPGIALIDSDFNEGDLILVVDERHGKSLAIGVAFFNSQIIRRLKRGKALRNVHYVGDKLWNFIKTL